MGCPKNPNEEVSKEFLQSVIDLAFKEQRSISFVSYKSNDELRQLLSETDDRGCHLIKAMPENYLVNVCPQSVVDFMIG